MERLTKMCDTSPESRVLGAIPGVGFQLIASVVCLQSLIEVGISFLAFHVNTMRVSCPFT